MADYETAIDSLSEPPLGNTPFELAMREPGDGVCLIGGVSPIVLANAGPEEVRDHVADLFRRVLSRRNLLLCTSDVLAELWFSYFRVRRLAWESVWRTSCPWLRRKPPWRSGRA
ncbi:MAG: hypothetical protein FJ011_02885 [Chloroflexi bacterium]|nr:hypothetical protein [Chloroflexota bacterium]